MTIQASYPSFNDGQEAKWLGIDLRTTYQISQNTATRQTELHDKETRWK